MAHADYRLFIKLHNGFPEHPKTGGLSDRAFRCLIEAWCYCSRNLTDGVITSAYARRMFSPKIRDELTTTGWLTEHPLGVEMTGYLEHQMSAQEVADLRNKRAEAGRKGGQAKASAKQVLKQNASPDVADKDIDKDVEEKPSAHARRGHDYPPDFEEFYEVYPRRSGKDAALRAWRSALKRADPVDVMAGAKRYADARRGQDPKFTKTPAAWLNGGNWMDEDHTEQPLTFGGGDTPTWEM